MVRIPERIWMFPGTPPVALTQVSRSYLSSSSLDSDPFSAIDDGPATPPSKSPSIVTLPELPEAPKYPCPHLTDEEVAQYLIPLYERSWYLGARMIKWNGELRIPLVLAKKMDFLTYNDALCYLNELSAVVREENVSPILSDSDTNEVDACIDPASSSVDVTCRWSRVSGDRHAHGDHPRPMSTQPERPSAHLPRSHPPRCPSCNFGGASLGEVSRRAEVDKSRAI